MINRDNVASILGSDVYDADGDKIGGVGQVYLDDATGDPSWVSVSTGWFGGAQSLVPLSDANYDADGGLRVPYSKDVVKDAPRVEDDQHLSPAEEEQLYSYYSRTDYNDWDGRSFDATDDDVALAGTRRDVDFDRDVDVDVNRRGVDVDVDVDRGLDVDRDRDLSMTRSEERLNVGKEQVEGGRVRLRKYVTTEEQHVTVPVQKEVLSVERTPVEGDARAAGIIGEGEQVEEVVLREERPVVTKETVAVENVAINKDVVTEQHEVTETVAKEHIEVEGDGVDVDGNRVGDLNRDDDRDRDGDDRSLWQKAKDAVDPDRDGDVVETGGERRMADNEGLVDKAKDKVDGDPRT